MVNLTGIVSKLTGNAEKLAMLYAVIQDPIGGGRGFAGAPNFIIDRLTHWKIPDPMKLLEQVMFYPAYSNPLKQALMAYIVGEGLEAVGQGKWGKVAKKAAIGLAKGTAIAAVAFLPAINPHGASGNPSMGAGFTGFENY